jgi:hypothetical protein
MQYRATPNYVKRNSIINRRRSEISSTHKQRVQAELKNALLSRWAMRSMEGKYIAQLIHVDEHIEGAVFGYQEVGFAMLVATNWRVIFLDRKPLFMNSDEVNYRVVSGVNNNEVGYGSTVVLHTRVKDYKLFTFNRSSAEQFVHSIETRCMEDKGPEGSDQ